ncbi:MAG: leucyl aminopeptidase [Anaerolineae bacterium]|nr:leucyl aminopeptidase [Anaerolineae bacterium]
MNIQLKTGSIQDSTADTIIVNLFKDVADAAETTAPSGAVGAVDQALNGAIRELIASGDLTGKAGEVTVLYPRGVIAAKRVLVAGMGKQDGFNVEAVRQTAAAAILRARELNAKEVVTIVHGAGNAGLPVAAATQATVEGTLLALYTYEKKEDEGIQSITIVEIDEAKVAEIEQGIGVGTAVVAGATLARDLVNLPPNIATPKKMAQTATQIAEDHNMALLVGGRKWAAKHNMGAFLAVAQGAGFPPKFIVMEHNGHREDLPTIVLVGKGITFDTGGISIKPSDRMGLMKSDMGGAAAVLGAMKTVGMLNLPLRVIGITPCTENMPDANAYRPADVITASNGKTIEIISTDAEGRMVLADALVYAKKYEPDAVIDLATLTGSCVVALGAGMAAGLFSTTDDLRDKLLSAGQVTQERLWPLPLWDDYQKAIESDVADMKNSGGRMGGVATSAIFLKQFADFDNWAHLDIAGMALTEKQQGYVTRGGTGFGARLLVEFLRHWSE